MSAIKRKHIFGDRLWALVRSGQAWRFTTGDKIFTIVASGKYIGTWSYSKNKKRLSYSFKLPDIENKHKCADGKEISKALPEILYDEYDESYFDAHKKYGKKLSWDVINWSKYRDQQLKPSNEVAASLWQLLLNYNEKLVTINYLHSTINQLQLFLGIASQAIFQEIEKGLIKELAYKISWLLEKNNFLAKMGVAKRQRFINRVIKLGPKKALRFSFPRTHRMTLNEIVKSESWLRIDAKELSSSRAPLSLNSIYLSNQIIKLYPKHKDFIIDYATRYNSVKTNPHPLTALHSYVLEAHRASELGILLPFQGWPADSDTAARWHATIVVLINDYYRVRALTESKTIVLEHKQHWSKLNPPRNWQPLYAKAEFENESKIMHHCISSYFMNTRSIYAHIEFQDEAASLELDINSGKIKQLYGHCNKTVSKEFHKHVSSWINQQTWTKINFLDL